MKIHLVIITISFLSVLGVYSQDSLNETIIKNVYLIDGNGNEPIFNSIKISNGQLFKLEILKRCEHSIRPL